MKKKQLILLISIILILPISFLGLLLLFGAGFDCSSKIVVYNRTTSPVAINLITKDYGTQSELNHEYNINQHEIKTVCYDGFDEFEIGIRYTKDNNEVFIAEKDKSNNTYIIK